MAGTEIYVRGLAAEQQKLGHDPFIIAPAEENAQYVHDGLRVYRYAVSSDLPDVAELYAASSSVDEQAFAQILDREKPDVLHVHGFTRAVTRKILETTRARGVRILFTYHTPTATCARGTLMRFGHTVCDGALDVQRCAACVLHSKGVPRLLAEVASRTPAGLASLTRGGRMATGLRMRELVALRHGEIRNLLDTVDHIIAPAEWVLQLLLRLGVARERITLNRQGTYDSDGEMVPGLPADQLRAVFLGRLDPSKGLHLVLAALARVPGLPLRLDIYGILQGEEKYVAKLRAMIERDSRVQLRSTRNYEHVVDLLREYDLLVVPSQVVETGPLVVLEAFSANVPVLGSNRGGIAELVRDGVDGILVPADDVAAWSRALDRLVEEPGLLQSLRANITRPRTMLQVARDLEHVYATVLAAA